VAAGGAQEERLGLELVHRQGVLVVQGAARRPQKGSHGALLVGRGRFGVGVVHVKHGYVVFVFNGADKRKLKNYYVSVPLSVSI
jgi:hypothetical protein